MRSVLQASVIRHGGLACLSAFLLCVRRVSPPLPVAASGVASGGCTALRARMWEHGRFQSLHGA